MSIVKAEKRNESLKAKRIRKLGFIPGCVYGSSLKESLLIQIPQGDVNQLLKTKSKGSKITLEVEGSKNTVLLKEISSNPVSNMVEHLSFQKIDADELITGTAQIVLINREKISSFVQQLLFEISYKALPANMVEKIEIDLEGKKDGSNVKVEDLDIAKNKDIELLVAPDTMVLNIVEISKIADTEPEADETEEKTEEE